MTSAPRSWTSCAVAAPMPVAPPTTTARLPSYRNASGFTLCPPSRDTQSVRLPTVGLPTLDRLRQLSEGHGLLLTAALLTTPLADVVPGDLGAQRVDRGLLARPDLEGLEAVGAHCVLV